VRCSVLYEGVVSGMIHVTHGSTEGLLQCVTMCCSVLQRVAVCCSVLQCVAVCCSVLHCCAVCCSVLQYCMNEFC